MELANYLVDGSMQVWGSWLGKCAIPFILAWALLYKVPFFNRSERFHEVMEYAGLVVIVLVTALAFAYGGWIGLGALAFLIAMR